MPGYRVKKGKAAVLRTAPAWTFGARQDKLLTGETGPGPGEFKVDSKAASLRSPAYDFGGGRDTSIRYQTPGPSEYDPPSWGVGSSKPAYSITFKPPPPNRKESTPGPGTYNVTLSQKAGTALRPPAFTFGTRWRPEKMSERRPGPNEYLVSPPNTSPKVSLKFRHAAREIKEAAAPGAGEYKPTFADRPSAPAYHFGVSREQCQVIGARKEERCTDSAGSMQLHSTESHASASHDPPKGWSWGTAERMPGNANDEVPGPGHYLGHKSAIGTSSIDGNPELRSSPSVTVASRRAESLTKISPGPSDYNPQAVLPQHPTIGFHGTTPVNPLKHVPGPGAYKPERADKLKRRNAVPAYSIGQRLKDPESKDRKPGCMAYKPLLPKRGPGAVTMKFRHDKSNADAKLSSTPGPADYATLPKGGSPAFTIGLRLKNADASTADEAPGPIYDFE
ncbi:hypothetical protein WJX72_004241 [[Myrmecia] bisecta]|uniref:Outer dense fiber protein 3 n=1 Tax=[Myrmecia] bisecta TaxID=41462 RepID=A0AAW1QQ23_9CHLO